MSEVDKLLEETQKMILEASRDESARLLDEIKAELARKAKIQKDWTKAEGEGSHPANCVCLDCYLAIFGS